jgi:chloramphenicol 3-O-phosphotransferase
VEVKEVRLLLLGNGCSGKTSLARALQDPRGLTKPIHVVDRTVGVNVCRGWRPRDGDLQVGFLL